MSCAFVVHEHLSHSGSFEYPAKWSLFDVGALLLNKSFKAIVFYKLINFKIRNS